MYDSTSLDSKKKGSGVVHGHIHNYNNLTYIHGHVHHNAFEGDLSDLNADSQLQAQSQDNNTNLNLSHNDCKPFEFFDFHNNGNVTPFSTIQLDQLPSNNNNNNNNTQYKRKFEELDDNILSQVSKKITNTGSNNNNNSINKYNNGTSITEDDCTPKIFEICCDINHGKPACHNKDGSKIESSPIQTQNNLIKNEDNILLNNSNFLTQNLSSATNTPISNSVTSQTHNINNMTTLDLQNNMKYLSDLNCNFDCDFDCNTINNNSSTNTNKDLYVTTPSDSNNNINNNSSDTDFFDRYCQLCEHDEPHEQHVYDASKTSMTSSCKTINSTNSTKSLDTKNKNIENVKLNQDMKILEDLCNISSLYEVPFAQHMSHHHQQMNNTATVEDKKDKREGTPTQNHSASNLLEPVIRSRLMEKLKSTENTNSNVIIHDHPPHHHHHHKIELHTHVPMINNPRILDNNKSKQTILNNAINFHVDSKMDPDDENNNLIPDIKPETMDEFNTLHANNNLNELNTINFNWNFKRDEENDMKCLWDDCHSGTGFNNLIDLQKHMFVDHVPSKKDDYSCHWQDCLFQGNDVCSLVNHINDQHGINFGIKINETASHDSMSMTSIRLESKKEEAEEDEIPTMYECKWDSCDMKFDSSQLLNEHIETEHIPKRQSHYICHWSGCGKNFTQRQKIFRHIKVHTGYKPFCCKICNKTFANQETLTQHNRTHSGEKPYRCDICGKCFGGSSSLKIHIRTHTGEKPLKCHICGKRFNESSNLNKHLKTHTKEFSCKHCGKRFATAKTLKAHETSRCCH
ncbi:zinc-responsive transcriptional regulator Zap1p [Monosporozyma unispora]